ncbi:hypothetical protein DB30_01218 [Enhygromyxa salina]|uniref:Uncharacterized protein n=1 Tax=Enhygromyxa salina TaxID=215803 RepID=A0A0C1Z4J7_9BACT|nr:hypothetical protein [Enhygromyxa salina]KIG12594.1 hypothetical protein DB30_01218 [Enhygromyxa salina]
MLHASIHIDLPSEPELRERTLFDWFSRLIGRELDPRHTHDVATVTGLSVFKPVTEALAQVGITDVLNLIVDRKRVYVDVSEDSGDLAAAAAQLDASGALEREFEVMTLTLSDRREGLRCLVEITLARRVSSLATEEQSTKVSAGEAEALDRLENTPELRLRFVARLDSMQIARGDTPLSYAQRLRVLARDPSGLQAGRERFAALVEQTQRALAQQLGPLCLASSVSPVELRLIRPGPRQLDHFRTLSWGSAVRPPKYRPLPIPARKGAYDQPFYHYYYDPYFDFVAWVTLSEIIAGRGWQGLAFEVVDPDGTRVFRSDGERREAASALDDGLAKLVELSEAGVIVDPQIPSFGDQDPGEIGDPRVTRGFAGDLGSARSEATSVDVGDHDAGCGASCGGCGAG